MSTTITQIRDRALDRFVENRGSSMVPTDAILIWRVMQDERAIYRRIIRDNRYFTLERVSVTSSSGSSGRIVDLASLMPPVGLTLKLELNAGGTEVALVDVTNTGAELAPRGYVDTNSIVEVGSDWSSASGTVGLTLTYVSLPVALNTGGALSQTVSLPDEWCELLDNRLAAYFARKDAGRSDGDLAALDAEYERLYADFRDTLSEPEVVRRFVKPSPRPDTV